MTERTIKDYLRNAIFLLDLNYDDVDGSTLLSTFTCDTFLITFSYLCLSYLVIIAEMNFREVYEEVINLKACFYQLGIMLDLPVYQLNAIKMQSRYTDEGLGNVIQAWLSGGTYGKQGHPPPTPTWRKLVEAVDAEAGGNNHTLAKNIAQRHHIGWLIVIMKHNKRFLLLFFFKTN